MLLACALYMVHMYIPSRQMLQAASNIAPRGVYVCGNTTTTSGLTVTLAREGGGSGDFALEAGALVLADQGHYFSPCYLVANHHNRLRSGYRHPV